METFFLEVIFFVNLFMRKRFYVLKNYPCGFQLEQFVLLVSVSAIWSNFVNMTDGPRILQCLAALTLLRS